ncbi:MAG: carboxypeptidase-like regulatory domain-containing protein [Planctomycetes bacterium]|nr:carboxypeptidase-like regulatory domain-containing protein [Planctomycetota bacterium]
MTNYASVCKTIIFSIFRSQDHPDIDSDRTNQTTRRAMPRSYGAATKAPAPMRKPLLLLVALGIAAITWWLLQTGTEPAPPPVPAAAVVGPRDQNAHAAGSALVTGTADTRTDANDHANERRAVGDQRGALLVRAVWADQSPAAGVHLFLREAPLGRVGRDLAGITTGADGTASFSELQPGRHQLRSDREDRQVVEVVAGPQQVTFTLKAGVHVRGIVRDAKGGAVTGATIWLQTARTTWDGGREVARSDGNGQFELQHMHPQRSLGAFAKGHGPSPLVDLAQLDTTTAPVRVELVLTPNGGELAGVVRDTHGKPVPAAIVAAGRGPRFLDHRGEDTIEAWTSRTTITATDGTFVLSGLPTGELPVAVRGDGFAVWRGTASIEANATTTLDVVLLASATLHGRIVNAFGIAEARAIVSAYDRAPGTNFLAGGQIDYDEVFGHVETTADADGHYVLTGIAPGEVHAFAQRGEPLDGKGRPRRPEGVSVAFVREQLQLEPGARQAWNPVLDDGNRIAGIMLYHSGQPMGDVFLTLKDEQSGAEHVMTNASDGRFEFLCLPASTFTLRVQYWDAPPDTPQLERSGLQPNAGLVELRAPYDKPVEQAPGRVVGRIDDAGRRIRQPAAVQVELHTDRRGQWTDDKLEDGAYRFERVDPCRFRIALLENGTLLAESDWFELPAAGAVDAGVLRTVPAGALQIVLQRGAGCEAAQPKLYLRRNGDTQSSVVEPGLGNEALAANLTPGDYELLGYFKGVCRMEGKATVRAGETTTVSMAMQAGTLCRFEIWLPEGTTATACSYRIVGSDGAEFLRREAQLAGMPLRPYPLWEAVPPGDWRLRFELEGGGSGEVAFSVQGSTEVSARIDVK